MRREAEKYEALKLERRQKKQQMKELKESSKERECERSCDEKQQLSMRSPHYKDIFLSDYDATSTADAFDNCKAGCLKI